MSFNFSSSLNLNRYGSSFSSSLYSSDDKFKPDHSIYSSDYKFKNDPSLYPSDYNLKYGSSLYPSDYNLKYGSSLYPSDYNLKYGSSLYPSDYSLKYGSSLYPSDYSLKYGSSLYPSDYKLKYGSSLSSSDYKFKNDPSLYSSDYNLKSDSSFYSSNYKTKYDPPLSSSDYKFKNDPSLHSSDYKSKYDPSFYSNDYKSKFISSPDHNKYKSSGKKYKRNTSLEHDDYKYKYGLSSKKHSTHLDHEYKTKSSRPLSSADKSRQKIAKENLQIVQSNRFHIDKFNVETIRDIDHNIIQSTLGPPTHKHTPIYIENTTTIGAAIENNSRSKKICILNFANAIQPGGGYLNGRGAQEETLCRQTLLYPTIDGNDMYDENKRHGNQETGSDIMIYSPNVHVIRDDFYNKITRPFTINVISSPAVDNRNNIFSNSQKLMEKRIRKIVLLAASKRNDILILGAFGCGVYKNDPKKIAQIFKKVLKDEGLKDYFSSVIFPIKDYKLQSIFRSVLNS